MWMWTLAVLVAAEVCVRTPDRCAGHENMCDCAGYDASSFRPEVPVYAGKKNLSIGDYAEGTCGYANAACELKWAVVCCEDMEAPADSEFQPQERELQTDVDFETYDEFCARAGYTVTEFDYDRIAYPGEGYVGPTGHADGTCGNVVAMAHDEFATCCCYDEAYCCPQGVEADDCMSAVDEVLVTGSFSYSYAVVPDDEVQICPTMDGLDLSVCLEHGLEDDDCCAAMGTGSCAPGFEANMSMPVSCGDGLYYTCCYSSCEDSADWHKNNEPSKDCAWVAQFVPNRCNVKGYDRSFASYSCPVACGSTCADSTEWYKNGEPSKNCAWVSTFPDARCSVKGADGTLGSYSCPDACGLDGTVVDSTSWYKNDEPDKDCIWVHRFASARCDAKGEDGTFAYEACVRSCSEVDV